MSQNTHDENGKKLSAREIEMNWYNNVYQGDKMKQLTLRAILMGAVLGGFMSLSNLYVGLKTGWGLGVAITACILSFAIWKTFRVLFPFWFKEDMSILENNCMQSTASSAGYSTGGTMVSAICAYLMITGHHMGWQLLSIWTFVLASLGVFLAIPMKRQMINIEQLRFPSGIASAETLKSLHAEGKEGMQKARSLGVAGLLGGAVAWFRDAAIPKFMAFPAQLNFPGSLHGYSWMKWTISWDMSLIMIAGGAIMGWKIAWSMLFGGIINYGFLAPHMVDLGAINPEKLGYREIVRWSTWAGASMMVTSGIVAFLMQWEVIKRSFSAIFAIFNKNSKIENDPLEQIEVPTWWFLTGAGVSGLGCIAVLYFAFNTSFIMGLVAVFMTLVLSLVACRATGESDITPIGAMGKITQLMFGVLAPSKMITNLMTASVTAGAAGSAADLLTDLKSGYLLGANPRKQFIAQYLGIFAGVLVVVPAFYLLVPDASVLGTEQWPAPSAQVWKAVAELMAKGLNSLHQTAQMGMLIGGIIGIIIPLITEFAPAKIRPFIPSAMGLGLSMVIPFFNSLSMFIGALIALILEKGWPKFAEKYVVTVSSGIIAGESIMGIIIALLQAKGIIG